MHTEPGMIGQIWASTRANYKTHRLQIDHKRRGVDPWPSLKTRPIAKSRMRQCHLSRFRQSPSSRIRPKDLRTRPMLEAQSNRQVTIKDLANSRDPTHGQISRPDPCQIPRPHPLPSPRGKRRQCSRAPGGGSKTVPITVPDISSPKTYNINHKTFSWLHASAYLNSKAKSNLKNFLCFHRIYHW